MATEWSRVLRAAADEIDRQAREPAFAPASVPLAQYRAAVAREDAACAERDAVQAELDTLRSREQEPAEQSVDDLAREIREAATDEPRMEWRHVAASGRGFWHRIARHVLQREARIRACDEQDMVPREQLDAANAELVTVREQLASARRECDELDDARDELKRERDAARIERNEARKACRDHHLKACESCAVTESDLRAAQTELAALRSSERERLIAEVVAEVVDLASPSLRARVTVAADRLGVYERARTAKEGAK